MKITAFAYSELWGTPRHWKVEKFHVGDLNLIVGKNASGKTRVINCINAFATLFREAGQGKFSNGHWQVELEERKSRFYCEIVIENGKINRERFIFNEKVCLERSSDGGGKIWNDQIDGYLDFKLNPAQLAMFFKRDALQHKFLEPIHVWSSNVRHYPFSSDLGKKNIFAASIDGDGTDFNFETEGPSHFDRTVELYCIGYQKFGDAFDRQILHDFRLVGYNCTSIQALPGADLIEKMPAALLNKIPVYLEVQEKDLKCPTKQFDMSMGMYRALALIIHFNYCRFSKNQSTVLIDDIGEGLDYERSADLIKIIMKNAKKSNIQVVMSSNDRFVMNEVGLEFWRIVSRRGSAVRVLDEGELAKRAESFKLTGLSNFDFFSKEVYR